MTCARLPLSFPVLALLLGALSLLAAAPAQAQTVWTSTLTVDRLSAGGNMWDGCDSDDASQDDCSVALSDDDINIPGVGAFDVELLLISRISGSTRLTLKTRPASGFNGLWAGFDARAILTIDGSNFAFADATREGGTAGVVTHRWDSPGISWSDNQQVSLKLALLSGPPGHLIVSGHKGRLEVSWTAPSSADGVTGYSVHYKRSDAPDRMAPGYDYSPSNGWVGLSFSNRPWPHVRGTSATISGLTAGTSYDVRVKAETGAGSSVWSSKKSAAPVAVASVPGVPRPPRVAAGSNAFAVSWTPPPSPDGRISGYELATRPATTSPGRADVRVWTVTTHTGTRTVLTRQEVRASQRTGSYFEFRVRARNSEGWGGWSGTTTVSFKTSNVCDGSLRALEVKRGGSAAGEFSALALDRPFWPTTTDYGVAVPHRTTHVKLAATILDSDCLLKVGKGSREVRVANGAESAPFALDEGANELRVKVVRPSGIPGDSDIVEGTYTVTVTRGQGATVTLSASPTTVWEGQSSRVTATLSRALEHSVNVPVFASPCPAGSWCEDFRSSKNQTIFIPPGSTEGITWLRAVRDADAEDEEVTVALKSNLPDSLAAGSKNSQRIKVLDLDNDRISLRSGKTTLAEGEETTVTLDLGLPAIRGTDESRFLVTVEGMGTGDNPAKPSRSVTNPSADGGDFSLWAEGKTVEVAGGYRYPGRARPRVSNGKLMLAVPFNKGDQTKTLKLKIGNDAVVELDETFKLKVAVQFGSEEKTAELDFTITDDERTSPERNDKGEVVDGSQDAKVYVLDPVKEWGPNYSSCLAVVRLVSNARGGVRLEQAVTIPVSVNGQKRSLTIGAGKTANWIENANKDVTVEVLRDELPEDGLVSRDDPATALTEGLRVAYYSLDGQNVIVYNPYEEHDVTRRYAYENGCVASPTVPEDEEGKRKYGPSSGTDGETLLVGFGQIAQTPPEVSITALDGDGASPISEGEMARFRLTADPAPAAGESISVAVTVTDSGEFVSSGQPNPRMVTIGEDGTADFSVATQDDDMDEPDGAITATVTPGTGYTVSDNTAEVEVEVRDNDAPVAAPPTEEKRAWQIRFGRSVSQQVVDTLQQRFSTTTPSGLQLTLAGETLTSDTPLEENHVLLSRLLGFERVSSQEVAQGSSFSFSPDGAGARLSFWGKGAFSSFNGVEDTITLTGDVTTALLGAEWSNERWQAGAALSHSWGNGSYQGDGDGADGRISSTVTGIFPYGRYALTPRLGIWATAGYGWGSLSLNPDGDAPEYNSNTTLALGAVGMDGLLLDGGSEGVTLTTTTDALFLKTSSEAVEGLASSEGTITRLRLGLEASRAFPLANGASLSPSLEVGLRQDSGDAETGFGMDLGAGLSWNDPEQGITATVKGRTLLSHGAEHFQDQGLALSFSWQPTPSNRGASLSLSHAVGLPAEGGMAALLNPTAIEVLDDANSSGERFEARLAYGFPFYNDRLTLSPAVATALSTSSRSYGLLWSLTPHDEHLVGEPWQLSLEGERQENLSSSPTVDHSLKLRFALNL